MPGYSLGHLENHALLRDLAALVTKDRGTTATLLAHIGEVHARRLYADAGYGSMYHYCLGELGFSEDMAGKRVTAARVARRFPSVLEAVAMGRLHLTALCLLSKPLRGLRGVAALGLIAAAESKTNEEIRLLLAERFPQPDLAQRVRALSSSSSPALERVKVQRLSGESAPERVESEALAAPAEDRTPVAELVVPSALAPAKTTPLSPGRFGLQLTISAATREKLQRAQDLLGHTVQHGDVASVLDRALDALIDKLERRRYGSPDRPRAARPTKNVRHIPAAVRRAVRARDGDRCTFESTNGKRCEERKGLQFDHITPVAKSGETTVANLRLRCHAHNQLEAERAFGAGFMQKKRKAARSPDHARQTEVGLNLQATAPVPPASPAPAGAIG